MLAASLLRLQAARQRSGLPDGLCDRGDVRQDGEGGHGAAREEKNWGPVNVDDSDDGEPVGSGADCDVDNDGDYAPGAGGGGRFALPPCTSKQRSSNYERMLATLIELIQLAKFFEKYMPPRDRKSVV